MKEFKSFKYELRLTKKQESLCSQSAGCSRFIWNHFLNLNLIAQKNSIAKAQEKFECQKCKLKINADLNASLNILAAGQAVIACGEESLFFSMKQEPKKQILLTG